MVYLGLFSKKSDIDSLISALKDINKTYKTNVGKKKDIIFKHSEPIIKYSMRKTLSFEKKRVEIDDSLGSVSYDFIVPYPPGYPILTPGEIINKEIIDYIKEIKDKQTILGIENEFINVIKEK